MHEPDSNHSTDTESELTLKKPRRKLLLPAILAVSLLGGGAATLSGCGDDNSTKPDTVQKQDKGGGEGVVADAGSDADLVV